MASPVVATVAAVWFDSLDLGSDLTRIAVTQGIQTVDDTTFGTAGGPVPVRSSALGLFQVGIAGDGYWSSGADAVLHANRGIIDRPLTWSPDGADGGLAEFMLVSQGEYAVQRRIGEMLGFTFGAEARKRPLVRGTILAPLAIRTAGGNGVGRNLGAVAAAQSLYAVLHVTAFTGTTPSLSVIVQSAPAADFVAPVTRATFTAATTVGSQYVVVPGPIADPWWRVAWTITGTGPSFRFAAAIGIQ